MDRIRCFELRDVGSIPAGPANCSFSIMALHYIGNVETLDRNQ